MKYIVSKEFFEKVPNAYFGVVVVKNFDNKKEYPFIEEMIKENTEKVRKQFDGQNIKEAKEILPYREAFKNIGINPNKYMCSIEALISRIVKGHDLPLINPIVDLGNALSIKYVLPFGAHDIDNFNGDIEIREANKDDVFVPFGSNKVEVPDDGEIIYVSGNEVKTRRWTWRQGERSKITEASKNIFFPIDGFTDVNKDEVINLQDELVKILKDMGLEVISGYVTKENPSFEW